jgi:hypothetical protein
MTARRDLGIDPHTVAKCGFGCVLLAPALLTLRVAGALSGAQLRHRISTRKFRRICGERVSRLRPTPLVATGAAEVSGLCVLGDLLERRWLFRRGLSVALFGRDPVRQPQETNM